MVHGLSVVEGWGVLPPTAKSFPPRSNFCMGGRRFCARKAAASSDLKNARFKVLSLGV